MRLRVGAALGALGLLAASCSAPPAPPVSTATPAMVPPPAAPGMLGDFTIDGTFEQGGWIRGYGPPGMVSLTLDGVPVPVNIAGQFFLGLDRDSGTSRILAATGPGGEKRTRALRIAPRDWPIERVNVPLRGSVPSESFMAIRQPELDAIAAARAVRSGASGWTQRMVWPVKGRISGRFGSQRIYQGVPGSYHSGLDIAPGAGVPYVAPAGGVVVLAAQKPFTLEGNLVIIDHGMGLNSAFLHSSRLAVKEGDRVKQGQLIGYVGATGRASGQHLHWSLKWQDARLDPLLFLPAQ